MKRVFSLTLCVTAMVCLFMVMEPVHAETVDYRLNKKIGMAEIVLGRLKVTASETGITGIAIADRDIIGNIYPIVLGHGYKTLADNSKGQMVLDKKELRISQGETGKSLIIETAFGNEECGTAVAKQVISLTAAGMLTVRCQLDASGIKQKIAQQRVVTVLGREFEATDLAVNKADGKKLELKAFKGSFDKPQNVVLPFGKQQWGFRASLADSQQRLVVQLYKSYRYVINTCVFSGEPLDVVLTYDFSTLIKMGREQKQTRVKKNKEQASIVSGGALAQVPESSRNILVNGGFESGLYNWRPAISTTDSTWVLDRKSRCHGRIGLNYTGNGTRHEGLFSGLCAKTGRFYTVTAWLKGSKDNQQVQLGVGGAPAPPRIRLKYQCLKTLTLTDRWQQYAVTAEIPDSWKGVTSVYAVVLPKNIKESFYIDNVALFAGKPETALAESKPYGLIVTSDQLGHVYEQGKKGRILYEINCPDGEEQPLALAYTVSDFWGKRIDAGSVNCVAGQKGRIDLKTASTGYFEVVLSLKNRQSGKVLTRNAVNYTVMKDNSRANRALFGMNFHMERPNKEQLDDTLKLLSFAGVGAIRAWWDWGIAERRKGTFNWQTFDDQIELCEKYDLDILCMIGRVYGPSWTGLKKSFAPPENLDDWNHYVENVVSRYKGKVKYWEIWNEPDIAVKIKHNPLLYVDLLKRAYPIIKRIDSKAKVVGVCGSFLNFIEPVFRAGALADMDVFSYHCYNLKYNPEVSLPGWIKRVKALMKQYGTKDNIPLWNTEVGVGDDRSGYVTSEESKQRICGIMARNYLAAMATGTEKLFWFSVDYHSTYTHSVIDYRLQATPALVTYNTLVSLLGEAQFQGKIELPALENGYAMKFKRADGSALVALWYNGFPAERKLNLAAGGDEIAVWDIVGAPIAKQQRTIALKSSIPVFFSGPDLGKLEAFIKTSRFDIKEQQETAKVAGKAFVVKPVLGPFNTTNRGFIIDWRLLGPFANPGGRGYAKGIDMDYLKPFGSEANAVISPDIKHHYNFHKMGGKVLPLTLKPVEYHGASSADYYGSKTMIDLKSTFKPEKHAVAYAFCYIDAGQEMDAQIRIGSDDGCKIWLNKKMVLRQKAYRAAIEDDDIVTVKLKKGINTLLVKITQDVGGWKFCCRLTDSKGQPLQKIKIWL